MGLACKICHCELDAFSGGRCRKCRQLVCANCTAEGASDNAEGLLCKECYNAEQEHEVQKPVPAAAQHGSQAPAWVWILSLIIIVGSVAYVIITPYLSTQKALQAIRTGNDQQYMQALDTLSNMGGQYALESLIEYVKKSPEPVRSRALRAIGAIPGNDSLTLLKKMQTSNKTPKYLQSVIIEALLEHDRRHSPE